MKKWVKAFRLRTLPLAFACVGMGSFLAAADGLYKWPVMLLTLLTTLFLQILSNLSNDYGDYVNGVDHKERTGPQRSVQSGAISPEAMKKAILVFILLSLVSGVSLLAVSLTFSFRFLLFFILGILSIAAAVYYTMGKRPYGYAGLGDISVFLFFGWVGVIGSYFLHTGIIVYEVFLPATSCSLFAVAVLNINNIRDINSDSAAGKRSIPVRIGRDKALFYHYSLLSIAMICAVIYVVLRYESPFQFLFLLVIPLLLRNANAVRQFTDAKKLDPYLKQMALTTLLFVILFGVGLLV